MIGISNSCEDATSLLSHGLLSNTHLCNIMREKLDKKLNNQNSDQNRIKILLDSLQNISESYPENSLLDFITEQLRASIERTQKDESKKVNTQKNKIVQEYEQLKTYSGKVVNDLYTEVQNLEKSNISLMNEISRMKKRELFILNGKDPDEISTF